MPSEAETRSVAGPITDNVLQVNLGDGKDRIGRLLWERNQLTETWVDLHRAKDSGRPHPWPEGESVPTSLMQALNEGWYLIGGYKEHVPDGKTVSGVAHLGKYTDQRLVFLKMDIPYRAWVTFGEPFNPRTVDENGVRIGAPEDEPPAARAEEGAQ